MTKKRIISLIIGICFGSLLLIGMMLFVAPRVVSTVGGIVIVCFSLAFGMIMPEPVSFLALIAGICMLVFPSKIVGVVFLLLGIAGAACNAILGAKKCGNSRMNPKAH